jgi:hypothetical protein
MLISIYWLRSAVGEKIMLREKKRAGAIAVKSIAMAFMLGAAWHGLAQDAKTPYRAWLLSSNT